MFCSTCHQEILLEVPLVLNTDVGRFHFCSEDCREIFEDQVKDEIYL